MEVDDCDNGEDLFVRKNAKKLEFLSDEGHDGGVEDQVVWERNVVVCNSTLNTQMYCVSYPSSKRDAWDGKRLPVARYKKNVRLLEMRYMPDTQLGSYDKKKAELMYSGGTSPQKKSNGIESLRANDEVYEGRAFVHDHPIVNAIGFMKSGEFFIHPLTGSFDMHRSIHALNKKKKSGKSGNSDEDSSEEEEEANADSKKPGSSAVRVKFSRPETERQKKRREASALHREKKIASDVWIPMKVHLKEDEQVATKMSSLINVDVKAENSNVPMGAEPTELPIRELISKAIICGHKEELVIEAGKGHMLSKQRIDELSSPELQLKAHMVKSHVMKTCEMRSLIDPSAMSTEVMIDHLKKCSRLVNGVWVLDSTLMFQNLPPAHSNTAGKTDLYRADLWRNARNLALCLIDGGHRVTRLTLMTCFKLSEKDADEILSTFGVKCAASRSWKLRIEKDEDFLNDPAMQKHVILEKQRWVDTFNELRESIQVSSPSKAPKKK